MKLLTYEYRGLKRVGVYVGDKIAHLSRLAGVMGRAEADAPSMRALIERWAELGPALHAPFARRRRRKAAELAPILMDPAAVGVSSAHPRPAEKRDVPGPELQGARRGRNKGEGVQPRED